MDGNQLSTKSWLTSFPLNQLGIYSLVMLLVPLLGDTRLLSSMATCRLPGGLPL